MKSLAEIITWLKTDTRIRNILVEIKNVSVQGVNTTLYLANRSYTSSGTDTPSNQFYTPCIVGGIDFTESMSLDNTISVSYGDLELNNEDGAKDSWLSYIWINAPVNIYIGDPTWSRVDYRLIFSGILSDISSRGRGSLNLIITDKLQKLNTPISEQLLLAANNTSTGSDILIPVAFGECFNVSPILTNPATLEYQVHTGNIERIIEVRDNGLPVTVSTVTLATGKFKLAAASYGQITCSVQGAKNVSYYNTIAGVIKEIVKNYGVVGSRLTDDDIDLNNFNWVVSNYPQKIGVYCDSRENVLDICNRIAASVGLQPCFNYQGKLKLVPLGLPFTGGSTYIINPEDIEERSIEVSEKTVIKKANKLAYCKNWTVQTTLAGGVPTTNAQLFKTEWLFVNSVGRNPFLDTLLISEEGVQEDTYLINKYDAITESQRRLELWRNTGFIYTVVAYAHLLSVELGDTINLTNKRFGLLTSKYGTVVNINRNWLAGRVTIGILV